MQLNSIFPRVSGRIVSVKLVWIRGNPGENKERGILARGSSFSFASVCKGTGGLPVTKERVL